MYAHQAHSGQLCSPHESDSASALTHGTSKHCGCWHPITAEITSAHSQEGQGDSSEALRSGVQLPEPPAGHAHQAAGAAVHLLHRCHGRSHRRSQVQGWLRRRHCLHSRAGAHTSCIIQLTAAVRRASQCQTEHVYIQGQGPNLCTKTSQHAGCASTLSVQLHACCQSRSRVVMPSYLCHMHCSLI